MQPNELRSRLRGVISFPVTPFQADHSLNLEGLRRNLRSLLKHPVCAVVAPAGTGEIHSLSPKEHLAVVKTTVEEVAGRVPVLAGAGFNPPIAAELAEQAAAAGADGILAFPPYYPPLIARFSEWMQRDEVVMSDVPWAVAWYGRCPAVWLPPRVQDEHGGNDFYAVNDRWKPVKGLYLTQVTLDQRFHSDFFRDSLRGQEWTWGRLVFESLARTNVPSGFPLKQASSGYLNHGQFFVTDWQRWRKGEAQPR
jgi:hypothetical protein